MKDYGITQFGWMGRSATSPEASRIDHLALEQEARQLRDRALANTLRAFGRVVAGIGRRIAAWRERQATYAELVRLDDRMLADIGLHRGEIRAAAALGRLPSRTRDSGVVDLGASANVPFLDRAANHNRPYKVA